MNIQQVKSDYDNAVLISRATLGELIDMAMDADEAATGHKRLVRELDVLLNGESGAAKQASLCDIVAQVRGMVENPHLYLHVMLDEKGNFNADAIASEKSPLGAFGRAGVEYDESYKVTTQGLIRFGPVVEA